MWWCYWECVSYKWSGCLESGLERMDFVMLSMEAHVIWFGKVKPCKYSVYVRVCGCGRGGRTRVCVCARTRLYICLSAYVWVTQPVSRQCKGMSSYRIIGRWPWHLFFWHKEPFHSPLCDLHLLWSSWHYTGQLWEQTRRPPCSPASIQNIVNHQALLIPISDRSPTHFPFSLTFCWVSPSGILGDGHECHAVVITLPPA